MIPSLSDRFDTVVDPSDRSSSSPRKGVRRGRSKIGVSWAKKIQIKIIKGLDQYSEEDLANSFCRVEDYQRMREETSEVCFLMKHGTKESDELTYRGLESKRDGEARLRRLHRYSVTRTVFHENDRQFEKNIVDPESIAEIYKLMTQSAREEALQRGNQDALDVGQAPSPPPLLEKQSIHSFSTADTCAISEDELSSEEFSVISDVESVHTLVDKHPFGKKTTKSKDTSSMGRSRKIGLPPLFSGIGPRKADKRGLVVLAGASQ